MISIAWWICWPSLLKTDARVWMKWGCQYIVKSYDWLTYPRVNCFRLVYHIVILPVVSPRCNYLHFYPEITQKLTICLIKIPLSSVTTNVCGNYYKKKITCIIYDTFSQHSYICRFNLNVKVKIWKISKAKCICYWNWMISAIYSWIKLNSWNGLLSFDIIKKYVCSHARVRGC